MTLRHEHRSATPVTLGLLSLALLVSACSGKGAEGICADGVTCGGSPVGVWNTVGRCEFTTNRSDQPLNPNEQIALPIIPVLTSSPINATTAGDQCSQLIYNPGTASPRIKSVNLWHEAPSLAPGSQVTFNADSTYTVALKFAGYNISHFTPYCLQAAGAAPTCSDLATGLKDYYEAAALPDAAGTKLTDFVNINCALAADSGCDCGYDYQVTFSDKGAWRSAGAILTQSSDPGAYTLNGKSAGSQAPSAAMVSSICQSDADLTLSGYNGSALFHVPGLRVLTTHKQ